MTDNKLKYWDNNSTTPCAAEVVADMLPFFSERFGNASSTHSLGRDALFSVAGARRDVGLAIGARSEDIVFTSGATESNNLVLLGSARSSSVRRKIVVSAMEHKSVLGPAQQLADEGFVLEVLPVNRNGVVDLAAATNIIDKNTVIVCVQGANNETGVIQPIHELVKLAHGQGALFHCDAAQMLGKVPVNVVDLGVDTASFSAHKVYGPKGIGVLYIAGERIQSKIKPIHYGGGQEHKLRPGTLNVAAIIGFASACRIVINNLGTEMKRISELRDMCEKILLDMIGNAIVNGRGALRLPGTISLVVPGIPADMLIVNLTTVCVSSGSACNSGALEPSHVLLAMKVDREAAESTLRISLGRYTTEAEVVSGCKEIVSVANELDIKLNNR